MTRSNAHSELSNCPTLSGFQTNCPTSHTTLIWDTISPHLLCETAYPRRSVLFSSHSVEIFPFFSIQSSICGVCTKSPYFMIIKINNDNSVHLEALIDDRTYVLLLILGMGDANEYQNPWSG